MAVNFGELADQLYAKNQAIAKQNAVLKDLDLEKRDIENVLLAAMIDAGTETVRGKKAAVSISETERFNIADNDKFFAFLHRRKAYHLFERRISATAAREMEEILGGKEIPGIGKFKQTRLNVRKA